MLFGVFFHLVACPFGGELESGSPEREAGSH